MPKDFSGKNLRGRNFKGQNLTGAKFIGADIRGANFTNAILREADFTRAKAGLQKRWTIFLVTISLVLSAIWGLMSGLTTVFLALLFRLDNIKEHTSVTSVLFLIVLLSCSTFKLHYLWSIPHTVRGSGKKFK
ncbi:MAG: pentapeptide repeat-containing protein [Microcoleus sp.]